MGVKEKLGELVNLISTNGSYNQLDEIVWDLLKDINHKNLDYIHYHSSKITIDYNDFLNIWYNFIKKNVLEISSVPEYESLDQWIPLTMEIV